MLLKFEEVVLRCNVSMNECVCVVCVALFIHHFYLD